MKVCMVGYTISWDPRPRREAKGLIARGDEVDFICLRRSGEKRHETIKGVNVNRLPIKKHQGSSILSHIFGYLSFFILAFFNLNILCFEKKYDIIQIHTLPDFLVFVALIPKLFGAKVILDMHDPMPELYAAKFGVSEKLFKVRIIKWLERISIKFADHAIAVHKPHLDLLVNHGNPKSKFVVLLNVADPKIFNSKINQPNRNDGEFRLIYHGLLAKRCGVDIAIKAISIVKEKIPNIKFHIYGEGDYLGELFLLTQKLNLDKWVYFSRKFVPLEEIATFIANSDIGVVPNRKDSFTCYILPTKLLEYVAMGKPVIASRTKVVEEYFDGSMIRFFQAGDERDLAEQICDLYYHPQKRKELVRNSGRFNQKYNWECQRKIYCEVIDRLILGS